MIEGGTEKPGVPRGVFAMPDGMALRYDQPDAAIAGYITGYHVYGTQGPQAMGQVDWFLPGTANVRIAIDNGPIAVTIGRRSFDPTPQASLYGPTSCALKATTHGGVIIGFGVSALGWARLFGRPASQVRNLILPLAGELGTGVTARLTAMLTASDREHEVKPLLDSFLAGIMGPPHPDEAVIRQLMALIVDEDTNDLATAAARIGIDQHRLRRLASRHFGFPPKMLMIRARFLRSLLRMMAADGGGDYSLIARDYYDASHFLRDANTFLGMTPRRFMALAKPFLEASLRARAAVLGAATQALHDIDAAPPPHPASRTGLTSLDTRRTGAAPASTAPSSSG